MAFSSANRKSGKRPVYAADADPVSHASSSAITIEDLLMFEDRLLKRIDKIFDEIFDRKFKKYFGSDDSTRAKSSTPLKVTKRLTLDLKKNLKLM